MLAQNSAQLGYLQELVKVTSDQVNKLWHDVLTGVSGYDTNLVRLAQQRDPPPTPAADVNWMAFQVIPVEAPFNFPDQIHIGDGDGYSLIVDQKPEDVIVYCYGPGSMDMAATVRRAIHITQNRDDLFKMGIGIQQVSSPRQMTLEQNNKWYARCDLVIHTVREAVGRYEILNLLSAHGLILTDITHGANEPLQREFDTDNIKNKGA